MYKHPIQVALEENGNLGVRSYSGRRMYGRECLAVTGENFNTIMSVIVECVTDENREAISWACQAPRRGPVTRTGRDECNPA